MEENVSVNGICPICKNECQIDVVDKWKFDDATYSYSCNQCGKFILPIHIACLVGDKYEDYKKSSVYDDTYDREKMMETLKNAIKKYADETKDLNRAIRFCRNKKEKETDDRKDERIFLTWDENYNIQEIK